MKIIFNGQNQVRFQSLRVGDCFILGQKDPLSPKVYRKILDVKITLDSWSENVNCIILDEYGITWDHITDDTLVCPVEISMNVIDS